MDAPTFFPRLKKLERSHSTPVSPHDHNLVKNIDVGYVVSDASDQSALDDNYYPGYDVRDDMIVIQTCDSAFDVPEDRLHNPEFIDQRSLAHDRIISWPHATSICKHAEFATF